MAFPEFGGGQSWSTATLPLSSKATTPSLYLRSPNVVHWDVHHVLVQEDGCRTGPSSCTMQREVGIT